MRGLWAVLRKELLETTSRRRLLGGPLGYVVALALIVGGAMPAMAHRSILEAPLTLISCLLIFPSLSSSNVAAYSFAGERERRTLETLLSTPLADWQISLGKIFAAVVVGVAVSILATAVAYLAHLQLGGGPTLVPLHQLVAIVAVGAMAINTLTSSLGAIIALRVTSAQMVLKLTSLASVSVFLVLRAERSLLLAGGAASLLAFVAILIPLAAMACLVATGLFNRARWLRV